MFKKPGMGFLLVILYEKKLNVKQLNLWISQEIFTSKCTYSKELGHELRRPEADLLRDNIYELRIGLQGINYRILYFFHGKQAALSLFQQSEVVTSKQIGELFGFKPRTSAQICKNWVESGFLKVVDPSNRARKYKLSERYEELIEWNASGASIAPLQKLW